MMIAQSKKIDHIIYRKQNEFNYLGQTSPQKHRCFSIYREAEKTNNKGYKCPMKLTSVEWNSSTETLSLLFSHALSALGHIY
jgi:hypothetical protein